LLSPFAFLLLLLLPALILPPFAQPIEVRIARLCSK
jgi:hypothetical protein